MRHISTSDAPDEALCGTQDDKHVITLAQWMVHSWDEPLPGTVDPYDRETCESCIYVTWDGA